jgi:3-oxoacyl-[acyl-carrier protein] reductase
VPTVCDAAPARPVAIVTGGGGGIGSAIVHRLVAAGWAVAACDVAWSADDFAATEHVEAIAMDVRDPASVDAAVAAGARLGTLTAVVNCAGVLRSTPIEDVDDDNMTLMWEVNVAGVARLCRAAVRASAGLDAIVNVGSIASRMSQLPGISVYGATKAGVESFTRALAYELGPRGVRVNAIAPGFIEVPMSESMRRVSGGEEGAVTHVPLGRMGTPSEIAEVTEFLLSGRASYVHGAVVVVDGGACVA